MKVDDLPETRVSTNAATHQNGAASAGSHDEQSVEMFQQLGTVTRQLHDTLNHLGVLPKLQNTFDGLPDARSRLTYIAEKTGQAAEKVLNLVEQAKAEHDFIASETRRIAKSMVADPVKAVASGSVMNFVTDVEAATARIDGHLTNIMLAQDFHDLTGQVVAKVVSLASDLEAELLKILVQHAPPEQVAKIESHLLNGPVVNPDGRADVVTNQGEVDDLLASLGF
jgi:chemotaxis protein CheZ